MPDTNEDPDIAVPLIEGESKTMSAEDFLRMLLKEGLAEVYEEFPGDPVFSATEPVRVRETVSLVWTYTRKLGEAMERAEAAIQALNTMIEEDFPHLLEEAGLKPRDA